MPVNTPTRNYSIDLLRVLACYMVIQVHAGEFYYIHKDGNVLHTADAAIVGWYNSFLRICVPLFVVMTGFFMFPVGDTATFFKKRLSRVVIPFVIWCAIYAFGHYMRQNGDLQQLLINIMHIPVNYGSEVGHLWYVYMLIGLYLFAPIISPWIQTTTRKGMEFYLIIWAIACSLPYVHLLFPAVWGEVWWNRTPLLYHFSGLLGYVILAAYIKRFHMQRAAWNYYVGAGLIIAGYLITALTFEARLPTSDKVWTLELSWGFDTVNVAMMTAGVLLIVKNIRLGDPNSLPMRIMTDIAAKSYGIYLAHIIVLNKVHELMNTQFSTAAVKVPFVAVVSFIGTTLLVKMLSYLPKSKWLIG